MFPLSPVSRSGHSSQKVVASPKTQVFESGVSVCSKTYIASHQVRSEDKVSPVKSSMYFLDPLNSPDCNWDCLKFYQD